MKKHLKLFETTLVKVIRMSIKTYSELCTIATFEERYDYLRLGGRVGEDTFGFERYLNQKFYQSTEWRHFRDSIIVRDFGCDLGLTGYEIHGPIYLHHLNPLTVSDLKNRADALMNPENVICTSFTTHQAIHYGDRNLLPQPLILRTRNDTCPWKQ